MITEDTFVYTFLGRRASIGSPPKPCELSVSLARIFRFSGNTRTVWTVLSHLIATSFIVRMFNVQAIHGASLHDACECMTGDTPTPFKTPEASAVEDRILKSIYSDNNVLLSEEILKDIKRADRISLVAEAHVLLPENVRETFVKLIPDRDKVYLDPAIDFVKRLSEFQASFPKAYEPYGGVVRAYTYFLERMSAGVDPEDSLSELLRDLGLMGMDLGKRD